MSQNIAWLQSNWIAIFEWFRLINFEIRAYIIEVLEHLVLFIIFYILACVLLYCLILHWKVLNFQRDISGLSRVMIVIAHPDDETMFFGPTVLRLVERKDCILYLMCLSTGNNCGLGKIRKKELYEACKVLGIKEECVILHNHTLLPDSMEVKWPTEVVSQLILHQIHLYDIDTLITFDKHGVSKHLNHCSIYYAIANLSTSRQLPETCSVYVLETTNLLRKYWLLLDLPICYLLSRFRFISSSHDRRILRRAMQMHKSQFLWFRKLYFIFSRYLLLNTLQKMDLLDIELDLDSED